MNKLTDKEIEVCALLLEDENYKLREIATKLNIDMTSVAKRLDSSMKKFNVLNKYRLVDNLTREKRSIPKHKLLSSYRVKPFSFYDDNGNFIKIMITGQGQTNKIMEVLTEIGGVEI